jgi:hypothetical protein
MNRQFEDINGIERDYEDVQERLGYLSYDRMLKRAELLVGRGLAKSMSPQELANLIESC